MTPDPPPIIPQAPDPKLAASEARASADQTAALQDRLTMDTSSVMARYGSQMALAGSTPAPTPAAGAVIAAPAILPSPFSAPGPSTSAFAPLFNPMFQIATTGKVG